MKQDFVRWKMALQNANTPAKCKHSCTMHLIWWQKLGPEFLPSHSAVIMLDISTHSSCVSMCELMYGVSQKIPPEFLWYFYPYGWEFLVQILHAYYMFPSMLDYKFVFSYLPLWRSYTIVSATTIICPKCPPLAKTHAGWSHLIWHNFVTDAVN